MIRRPRGQCAQRGRSYGEISAAAVRLRRQIAPEVDDTTALPGVTLFERLDRHRIIVDEERIALDPDVNKLPIGIEANTQFDSSAGKLRVVLSEATYHALERGDARARFTLAHELGHVVLHSRELIALGTIPELATTLQRQRSAHKIYQDTEWQADVFSARLLMPTAGIRALRDRGPVTSDKLIRVYGVSHAAASQRLKQFKEGKP